jgi:D-glycero-beta-D-manno-heptose-7-phosphate kinase
MQLKKLLSSKKVLVVGDIILDHYIHGKVYRVSPEAPVPVVLKNESVYCLGGASNVAQNITSFGSECYLLGVTGEDEQSRVLENLLKENGVSPFIVKDPSRTTTEKTRIIGNGHQITRIDTESTDPISDDIKDEILSIFRSVIDLVHGVILQDYGKGLLTPDLIQELISISKEKGRIVLVDPKDKDFSRYSGATWIKPNLSEFKNALDIPQQIQLTKNEIYELSDKLCKEFSFNGILVTMSEEGMMAKVDDYSEYVNGDKIEVTDVSGAGDTVSAVFLLMQISNINLRDTLRMSNLAGSLVCQISGAVPIDTSQLFKGAIRRGWVLSNINGENVLI